MATFDAPDLNSRNIMSDGAYGNAATHTGKVTPTALANADILRVVRIPAGFRADFVLLGNDDLDSNGAPTAACKVGYTPVNSTDGPAASDAYWAAAGQTYLQAAGSRVLPLGPPVVFDYDVWLIITMTAASATFAAGSVWATVIGENVGTK